MAQTQYELYQGNSIDVLHSLKISPHLVLTSPPYFKKRKYGTDKNEVGWENEEEYLDKLVEVFESINLHPRGSIWVNLGDTRADGDLLMIPERFALKMKAKGWKLVDSVIWAKIVNEEDGGALGHCMIEPANNRLNGNGYENFYHFIKCKLNDIYADNYSIRIPRAGVEDKRYLPEDLMDTHSSIEGRCLSNVWRIRMGQSRLKHYAVFPTVLCERPVAMNSPMRICNKCGAIREREIVMQEYDEQRGSKRIFGKYSEKDLDLLKEKSGRMDSGRSYIPKKPVTVGWKECSCKDWVGGIVLDPFCGTSSTGEVSLKMGRRYLGIDLYAENIKLSEHRCKEVIQLLNDKKLDPMMLEQ